jgi:hypothetical protein
MVRLMRLRGEPPRGWHRQAATRSVSLFIWTPLGHQGLSGAPKGTRDRETISFGEPQVLILMGDWCGSVPDHTIETIENLAAHSKS